MTGLKNIRLYQITHPPTSKVEWSTTHLIVERAQDTTNIPLTQDKHEKSNPNRLNFFSFLLSIFTIVVSQ